MAWSRCAGRLRDQNIRRDLSRKPEANPKRAEGIASSRLEAGSIRARAYSYVPVGAMAAPERLAEAVADTLFFGGEATATGGQLGTVHGALESGTRAARELISK